MAACTATNIARPSRIHEFLRSLDPATLAGVGRGAADPQSHGVSRAPRSSPFEGFNNTDLNRCFPGNEKGGFTERMAHAIYRDLKRYATHFIDFHTAYTADTRWALYADTGGDLSPRRAHDGGRLRL